MPEMAAAPVEQDKAGEAERKCQGLALQPVSQPTGFPWHIMLEGWVEEKRRNLAHLRSSTQAFESSQGGRTQDEKAHISTPLAPSPASWDGPTPRAQGVEKPRNAAPLGKPLRAGGKEVPSPGACERVLVTSAEKEIWVNVNPLTLV